MSFSGTVEATGTEVVQQRLEDIASGVRDLSPAWPGVGEVFAERQNRVFDSRSFGRWAPLAASTIVRKRNSSVSGGLSVLQDTRLLRDSLTRPTPRSSGPGFAVFGPVADIPYAKYHVRGMGNPQRHPMPKFTPTERANLVKKLREYIQRELNGA
jgi:hypothetical protein